MQLYAQLDYGYDQPLAFPSWVKRLHLLQGAEVVHNPPGGILWDEPAGHIKLSNRRELLHLPQQTRRIIGVNYEPIGKVPADKITDAMIAIYDAVSRACPRAPIAGWIPEKYHEIPGFQRFIDAGLIDIVLTPIYTDHASTSAHFEAVTRRRIQVAQSLGLPVIPVITTRITGTNGEEERSVEHIEWMTEVAASENPDGIMLWAGHNQRAHTDEFYMAAFEAMRTAVAVAGGVAVPAEPESPSPAPDPVEDERTVVEFPQPVNGKVVIKDCKNVVFNGGFQSIDAELVIIRCEQCAFEDATFTGGVTATKGPLIDLTFHRIYAQSFNVQRISLADPEVIRITFIDCQSLNARGNGFFLKLINGYLINNCDAINSGTSKGRHHGAYVVACFGAIAGFRVFDPVGLGLKVQQSYGDLNFFDRIDVTGGQGIAAFSVNSDTKEFRPEGFDGPYGCYGLDIGTLTGREQGRVRASDGFDPGIKFGVAFGSAVGTCDRIVIEPGAPGVAAHYGALRNERPGHPLAGHNNMFILAVDLRDPDMIPYKNEGTGGAFEVHEWVNRGP